MPNATAVTRKTFEQQNKYPPAGSPEEQKIFHSLQQNFRHQFENIFPDDLASKTVVIVPSLTLDEEMLDKIQGHIFYEERMLCMLMLLRMPRTKIIYVTSIPVDEVIIDYYLHLLPGITGFHAKQRLTMLSCHDASAISLTQKILKRPRLIDKIKNGIQDFNCAHLVCFNVTTLEKTLAVQLGIPMYGTDPDLFYEGTKSGSRKIFKACDIPLPDGFEDIYTRQETIAALAALKQKYPSIKKAVIKTNEGFSGEGNAIYYFSNQFNKQNMVDDFSSHIKFVAKEMNENIFFEKMAVMGGVVELFIEGDIKASPSVQCRINPLQQIEIISTHDQLLGGTDTQVFFGANFPANNEYNIDLVPAAQKIATALAAKNVLGRFSIDFISVKEAGRWKHYAIEINLRKGGTTHPFLMLQFLTDGVYNANAGKYTTAAGNERFYFATDNIFNEKYKGLTPQDLIEIAMFHSLMYNGTTQEGVMFHLLGALSQYGKLGIVCIGSTLERANAFYKKVIAVLDLECS